jgi:hypothetical protein
VALAQLLADTAPDEHAAHTQSTSQRQGACRSADRRQAEGREGRAAEHDQPNSGSRLGADQRRHYRARREFGLIGA